MTLDKSSFIEKWPVTIEHERGGLELHLILCILTSAVGSLRETSHGVEIHLFLVRRKAAN